MKPPAVPPAVRAGIVARVMSKKSTAAAEGARYKIPAALVRNWVFKKRNEMKLQSTGETSDPTKLDTTDQNAVVSTEGARVGSETSADPAAAARARAAAGISSPGATPKAGATGVVDPATLAALAASEEEDKRFVVESYRDAKEGALDPVISQFGLTLDHPYAKKLLRIPMPTEQALKANASWIAPKVREKMVGWIPLLIGLSIDVVVTLFTFRSIAAAIVKERLAEDGKPADPPKV